MYFVLNRVENVCVDILTARFRSFTQAHFRSFAQV